MGIIQNLTAELISQDYWKNTSTIKIKLTSTQSDGTFNNSTRSGLCTFSVNNFGDYESSFSTTFPSNATVTCFEIIKTVDHNPDGSCTVDITTEIDTGTSAGTITKNISYSPASIPRASSISTPKDVYYMGDTIPITINRTYKDYRHTIHYEFAGLNKNIVTDATTSASWTPDLATAIPNANSASCKLICTTYYQNRLIGSKTKMITLKIPENVLPTGSLVISESETDVLEKFGTFTQNLSRLHITASGQGAGGSTITAYKIWVAGVAYDGNNIISDVLRNSGPVSIVLTLYDSRGRKKDIRYSIDVQAYSPPNIEEFKIERATGGKVNVRISASVDDNPLNVPSYSLTYKKVNIEGSTESYPINDTTSSIFKRFTISNIDVDYRYFFTLTVSDLFNSITRTILIETSFSLWEANLSGRGLAIGKASEDPEALEINLPIKITNCPWISFGDFHGGSDAFIDEMFDKVKANPPKYRKIANHVYITGRFITLSSYDGQAQIVFDLPVGYRPSNAISKLLTTSGSNIGRMQIYSDGRMVLDWIISIATAQRVTGVVSWIDLTIDFFTD